MNDIQTKPGRKIAVVLFNLGGPDSEAAIKPFLYNFFMDRNIIRVPKPLRFLIATLIANRRTKKQAGESYGRLGGRSPLLPNTEAQAEALQQALQAGAYAGAHKADFKVFVCMRYWHPMAAETVARVKDWQPDHIVLLPLYPQFSTTTTWSSLGEWQTACAEQDVAIPTNLICCYPTDAGFVEASAANIRRVYTQALEASTAAGHGRAPRVLFSAHGLPKSVIRDGDPYQYQCEATARRIAEALAIEGLDWSICYQSRVGPQKWIGPSTEEALEQAAYDKVPVVIYPHAFVSEHVETLVEIEEEYREMAEHMGLHDFYRVPTVSTHEAFISGLARLVEGRCESTGIAPDVGGRLCPSGFTECCMAKGVALSGAAPCAVPHPTHPLDRLP